MEGRRLVVRNRAQLPLGCVHREDLGVQPRRERSVYERRVARVDVQVCWDGHEACAVPTVSCAAELSDERAVNCDEVRVDEVAEKDTFNIFPKQRVKRLKRLTQGIAGGALRSAASSDG